MLDIEVTSGTAALDFVWLELTNQCNLKCTHCYAQSSPTSGKSDSLTTDEYLKLLVDVRGGLQDDPVHWW